MPVRFGLSAGKKVSDLGYLFGARWSPRVTKGLLKLDLSSVLSLDRLTAEILVEAGKHITMTHRLV